MSSKAHALDAKYELNISSSLSNLIIIITKCIYIAHIQMIKMLYALYKKKKKIEAG